MKNEWIYEISFVCFDKEMREDSRRRHGVLSLPENTIISVSRGKSRKLLSRSCGELNERKCEMAILFLARIRVLAAILTNVIARFFKHLLQAFLITNRTAYNY